MNFRFPAEWEPHEATLIAWPHAVSDWPGKFAPIKWVYSEIVRLLSQSERVDIVCLDARVEKDIRTNLSLSGVTKNFRLLIQKTDRSWLRDSAPTVVVGRDGRRALLAWKFNGWAKYSNFSDDAKLPSFISETLNIPLIIPTDSQGNHLVLEGGGIESDGEGTLLVTEEWLLSDQQIRNPGYVAADYERHFRDFLGIEKTIWISASCEGDDTHGHIDDVVRFVAPAEVVVAVENRIEDPNWKTSQANLRILQGSHDARGRKLIVHTLPFPEPVFFDGQRLPASYANFYIGNSVVLVPVFNDANDAVALTILQSLFPQRAVVGVYSRDLVLGLGTLHCLTQQIPR